MYDATMSEQREVLLGNYIIQQVLSLPALSDELFVQICVQMWAKHQSDVSRSKISHLMSMCLSVLPPSADLYKYLLKYASDRHSMVSRPFANTNY
ncbi:Myo15 [Bugula neritina]|uniref:Myo15 n=1 Tax=Bugula neritina TaxID=10212 RepID=A0A7J7JV02_BUGNE|nr:Myo15 [Bugula neritina]